MTDGVQDNQGAPAVTEGEPRLFGGQFGTVEELEAAFAALQKPAEGTTTTTTNDALKATKTASEETASSQADGEGGDEGADPTDEAVADALKAAGLDQTKYTQEFAETGNLSDASYAELEKAGYPREMAEVYVDGLKARRAAYEAEVLAPAGGKEGYGKLLEWAGKNLTETDIDAFNAAITSGNAAQAKLAVSGLAALAAKATGNRPQFINGRAAPSGGAKPYASRVEAAAAVRDPRYRNDPGYRQAHEARLRVTDFA